MPRDAALARLRQAGVVALGETGVRIEGTNKDEADMRTVVTTAALTTKAIPFATLLATTTA